MYITLEYIEHYCRLLIRERESRYTKVRIRAHTVVAALVYIHIRHSRRILDATCILSPRIVLMLKPESG